VQIFIDCTDWDAWLALHAVTCVGVGYVFWFGVVLLEI
jgi:hypothetical protein